jgi:hypothetical protein
MLAVAPGEVSGLAWLSNLIPPFQTREHTTGPLLEPQW